MQKIEQTIEQLLRDAKPAKAASRSMKSFCAWGLVTALSTVVLALLSTVRPDLMVQLGKPVFVVQVVALIFLIFTSALVALELSFPDIRQRPKIVYLPLLPLIVYLAAVVYQTLHPETETILPDDIDNGINCVICITIYSLVPGFWMFRTIRRCATTHPMLAGAISLLASASIGLLVLKFVEGNDSFSHLLLFHLIPIAVLGIIGALLGKRFLRW